LQISQKILMEYSRYSKKSGAFFLLNSNSSANQAMARFPILLVTPQKLQSVCSLHVCKIHQKYTIVTGYIYLYKILKDIFTLHFSHYHYFQRISKTANMGLFSRSSLMTSISATKFDRSSGAIVKERPIFATPSQEKISLRCDIFSVLRENDPLNYKNRILDEIKTFHFYKRIT